MTPLDLGDQPARYEKLKLIHHFLLLNIFDIYTTQTFIETNSGPYLAVARCKMYRIYLIYLDLIKYPARSRTDQIAFCTLYSLKASKPRLCICWSNVGVPRRPESDHNYLIYLRKVPPPGPFGWNLQLQCLSVWQCHGCNCPADIYTVERCELSWGQNTILTWPDRDIQTRLDKVGLLLALFLPVL